MPQWFGKETIGLATKISQTEIQVSSSTVQLGKRAYTSGDTLLDISTSGFGGIDQGYVLPEKEYKLFRVLIEDGDHELVFYKSPKSGRWWVEVPIQTKENKRHTLVPCAHQDYLRATKGEIPMRWWKALQKGM